MPPSILSGAAARVRATAPTNSVRRRHVSKSGFGKRHDAPTRAAAWVRAWPAFPARNVPGGVNAGWRRGDATRARVIDPHPGRGALTAEEAQLGGELRAEQPTGGGGSPAGDKRPIDRTENAEGPARKR